MSQYQLTPASRTIGVYRIYHHYIPHGYPRNRITRRDNTSRVKSPGVRQRRSEFESSDVGTRGLHFRLGAQNEIEIYRSLRGGAGWN